jgi:hypothetical protein
VCTRALAPVLACIYWNLRLALVSRPQARNSKASPCMVVGFNLLMVPLPFQARGLFLFSIFIFGTGSRFQPMTRVHPHTSPFPPQHPPILCYMHPFSFKISPHLPQQPLGIRFPQNQPLYSFRPHSTKSRYQEMEIVLARIFSALKRN